MWWRVNDRFFIWHTNNTNVTKSEVSVDDRGTGHESVLGFVPFEGGIYEIGAQSPTTSAFEFAKFVFDNESPRHEVLVRDFEIAVSNRIFRGVKVE